MVTIRLEKPSDAAAREALLDLAYGPVRFTKPSERLRAGRKPARGLSFVAVEDGPRRRHRTALGGRSGSGLFGSAARAARGRSGASLPRYRLGADAARFASPPPGVAIASCCWPATRRTTGAFGFSAERTAGLWLPGLADRTRLLARELAAGALDGVRGAIRAPSKQTIPLAAAIPGLARPEPKAA
jgi:hypothetical protein